MMSNQTKWSRREFLRLASVAAAGAGLAACAPAAAPQSTAPQVEDGAPPAQESIALDYWIGWGGNTTTALQEIADKFTAEVNPDVSITVTGGVALEKVLTAIAGATLPDLGSNVPYMTMIARGVCLPVTEWVNSGDTACIDDIPDGFWLPFTWQGEIYGIPGVASFASHAFGYNIDLVAEAGLDPDSPPQTWDEVFSWHEAITTFDDAGNLVTLGFDPLDAMAGSVANNPFFWPISWGFDWFDEASLAFDLDRSETVEFFHTIKRYYDHVGAEKMSGFRTGYGTWTASPNAGFPAGAQAMIVTGSWAPGWLAISAPDRNFAFTWMPVPAGRKGTKAQTLGGHTALIYNTSDHPQEAFAFERYMTCDDEAADLLFETNGFQPGRLSWWQRLDPADYPTYDGLEFFIRSITGEADELWGTEANPVTEQTNVAFRNLADGVIYGDITPEEAAPQMQADLTQALAEMLEE